MTTYLATSTSSVAGVASSSSTGVDAVTANATGSSNGVSGFASGTEVGGVFGKVTGEGFGVWGEATSAAFHGVLGQAAAGDDDSEYSIDGVYGYNDNPGLQSFGIIGEGLNVGVFGQAVGGGHNDIPEGVHGTSSWGVRGFCNSDNGVGVYGDASSSEVEGASGIYGISNADDITSWAGYFNGPVGITGYLTVDGYITKGGGGFLVDHPLDPANKFLEHSFVESPERKNIYDGIVTANSRGEATLELPEYFEAANMDFRYQLTAIGKAAPELHVRSTVANGRFTIAGAGPGQKISWQVTGVRRDAWALANPLIVERKKAGIEKGLYRHPELHGQPVTKGISYKKTSTKPGKPKAMKNGAVRPKRVVSSSKPTGATE